MDYSMLSALTKFNLQHCEDLCAPIMPLHNYIMAQAKKSSHKTFLDTFLALVILYGTASFKIHLDTECTQYSGPFLYLSNSVSKQSRLQRAVIAANGFQTMRTLFGLDHGLMHKVSILWIRAVQVNKSPQRVMDVCCDLFIKVPWFQGKLWRKFLAEEKKEFANRKRAILQSSKHYKIKRTGVAYIDGIRLAEKMVGANMIAQIVA